VSCEILCIVLSVVTTTGTSGALGLGVVAIGSYAKIIVEGFRLKAC
jgi:hypothetical protein